jgi:hypothetical protein
VLTVCGTMHPPCCRLVTWKLCLIAWFSTLFARLRLLCSLIPSLWHPGPEKHVESLIISLKYVLLIAFFGGCFD